MIIDRKVEVTLHFNQEELELMLGFIKTGLENQPNPDNKDTAQRLRRQAAMARTVRDAMEQVLALNDHGGTYPRVTVSTATITQEKD